MNSDVKITGTRLQITRIFDAPRHLVFAYWTQPDKLQQWSSCKDATKCEVQMDFRAGGSFTQKMVVHGKEFTVTGQYDEIIVPERLAYHANLGFATIHAVVEFIEQGKQTKVILTHDGFPEESFCKIVSQGTSESLDKLDGLLSVQRVSA